MNTSGMTNGEDLMERKFVEAYRHEFPVTGKYIYLDHAGVAPTSLRVKTAIERFLTESTEGGSFHYPQWAQRIIDIRRACAQLVNAESDEIAFVKSTSHGLSIVAQGLDWKPGDNVLIYEKEFPSNIYPWLNLRSKGVEVRAIPSRNGRIVMHDIEPLMDARTRLLAISSVQFSNGFRIDLKKVGALCREKQVFFCVDAIQSLGMIPMDVKDCHIDFLSADAHKWLLGPEGIGIFYCRKELVERLSPPLIGWKSVRNEFDFDHPEFLLKTNALRFEEGSMNLLGIFGLGAALDLLFEAGIEHIERRVLDLGDLIMQESEKRGYRLLTPGARHERGGNITFSGNFDPVTMRDTLREKRVIVNARGGGIRVSPHFYNSGEDIAELFKAMERMAR
jgi:cysteine desulfurase/selenocysteine lyase